MRTRLISPIKLPPATSGSRMLTFKTWFDTPETRDFGAVQVVSGRLLGHVACRRVVESMERDDEYTDFTMPGAPGPEQFADTAATVDAFRDGQEAAFTRL